jgi:hypothetical protein
MSNTKCFLLISALVGLLLASLPVPVSHAASYEVGPGKPFARLSQVTGLLNPGDTVLVHGNGPTAYDETVIFTRPGTRDRPITIRGVRVAGRRPILSSAGRITVEFRADHYRFEGFEATGSGENHRVLYHHADDIVIRDTLIRDCPRNGLLGADSDSGSLTLDHVEVTRCGNGQFEHGIYMATGLPGAVFRMQHCYIHDINGGNAVKSRANRNEIYYNWIEGGFYHELELIGPDDGSGGLPDSPREDSDVVGNVLVKRSDFPPLVRVGGDGTGQSWGRYRFVNNTFVVRHANASVIRAFGGLESIELHNNVFVGAGGAFILVRTVEAEWRAGQSISGSRNWIQAGSTVPTGLQHTILGSDAGLVNLAASDLRPEAGSPLIDAGTSAPASASGHPFPQPLFPPQAHPPARQVEDGVPARPLVGPIDIGAFEFGAPPLLDERTMLPLTLR